METVLSILIALSILFGGAHLVGIFFLSAGYGAPAEVKYYPVPKMFIIKWILIMGVVGFLTVDGKSGGIFWRHIQDYIDLNRTNAAAIAKCKVNLRQLKELPDTADVYLAIKAEEEKLRVLQAHDYNVAAAAGLDVLKSDLAATNDSVAASRQTLSDVRQLPSS